MKDGIYTNISNEQYNEIDAIRASFLKTVLDNPRLAWFEKMNILPKETTASMQFGTLLHEAILEPEKYNARVIAGNQSKADKKIDAMIMMFNFSSKSKLINGSQKELTIITNGKKCRIDFFKQSANNPTQILIGDLKTTSKIDIMGLNYAIKDYRYVFQLAYYKKVFEEAIDRVKKGEIHSDIDVSKITDIATSLLFVCTGSPFDIRYLALDNYVEGKYNEKANIMKLTML